MTLIKLVEGYKAILKWYGAYEANLFLAESGAHRVIARAIKSQFGTR